MLISGSPVAKFNHQLWSTFFGGKITTALGGKNRVSEVLSGKRALTLGMVRSLNYSLGIPTELLVREPEVPYRVVHTGVKAGARKRA